MSTTDLTLPALKGSNLLGFLGALGAFRTLATLPETSEVRMRWVQAGGSFYPALRLPVPADADSVVERIHTALHKLADHYVITESYDRVFVCTCSPKSVKRN